MVPSSGVRVTAVTQLSNSDTMITWKSERQNSPVESCEVPIAAKAMMAMMVAPSKGMADCLTTSMAASRAFFFFCKPTRMPSTTTMALSTSMPRAMMRAPSEMRSRATPMRSRNRKDPRMVMVSTAPMSKPLRAPMKKSNTTMTMATASSKLTTKPLMAILTASDCRETTPTLMPSGISERSSMSLASSASPMVITLPPEIVEIPSAMELWPS